MTETKQVPVDLLPCPFCGESLTESEEVNDEGKGWAIHPYSDCYLSEWEFDQFDRKAWNTRAILTEQCLWTKAAPATEPSEVERLAVEIADEAAIQSIACECSHHYMDDGVTWADTSYASDNDVDLGPDLRYLDLRGLLEHHPDHPEWVRVKGGKS